MFDKEQVTEEAWLYHTIAQLDEIIEQFGAKVVAENLKKVNAAALYQHLQDRFYNA